MSFKSGVKGRGQLHESLETQSKFSLSKPSKQLG